MIPSTAWAIVNLRIHPSSSIGQVSVIYSEIDWSAGITNHLHSEIASHCFVSRKALEDTIQLINDERVEIVISKASEPHPVSPHGDFDFGYQMIKQTVEQVYDSTAVVPGKSYRFVFLG